MVPGFDILRTQGEIPTSGDTRRFVSPVRLEMLGHEKILIETTPYQQIHDLRKFSVDEIGAVISSDPGIYIWWSKVDLAPAYIGVALNKRGLLGRVVRQHLCPTYLELRAEKIEKASMVAIYKGRRAIEKSVFRKKISHNFGVLPGAQCIDFIKANFLVSFLPLPALERNDIKEIEHQLIAMHNPPYNTRFTAPCENSASPQPGSTAPMLRSRS